MRVSCGALLYACKDGEIGVVLGIEGGNYFPLKGGKFAGETDEQTAIREVFEESCGLVDLKRISLDCTVHSLTKRYHLGLVEVSHDIIEKFAARRATETRPSFAELSGLKFIKLADLENMKLPLVTYKAVSFYKDRLFELEKKINENNMNNKKDLVAYLCHVQNYSNYCTSIANLKYQTLSRLTQLAAIVSLL